jgi:hypothetical protein
VIAFVRESTWPAEYTSSSSDAVFDDGDGVRCDRWRVSGLYRDESGRSVRYRAVFWNGVRPRSPRRASEAASPYSFVPPARWAFLYGEI